MCHAILLDANLIDRDSLWRLPQEVVELTRMRKAREVYPIVKTIFGEFKVDQLLRIRIRHIGAGPSRWTFPRLVHGLRVSDTGEAVGKGRESPALSRGS